MIRFVEFCSLLVAIAHVASIPAKSNNVEPVVIVDFNSDISEIQEKYGPPELFTSSKSTALPGNEAEAVFRYTLGTRVLNDRIVSQNKDSYRWDSSQNVTLILQYPTTGQGAILTYIDIVVNQSSRTGRAHVLTGGIGQRFIVVIVEANNTYWFKYSSKIYGI